MYYKSCFIKVPSELKKRLRGKSYEGGKNEKKTFKINPCDFPPLIFFSNLRVLFCMSRCGYFDPWVSKNQTHCMPSVALIYYMDMDYIKPIKRTRNKSQNLNIVVNTK